MDKGSLMHGVERWNLRKIWSVRMLVHRYKGPEMYENKWFDKFIAHNIQYLKSRIIYMWPMVAVNGVVRKVLKCLILLCFSIWIF